jgi:hypothetical protein
MAIPPVIKNFIIKYKVIIGVVLLVVLAAAPSLYYFRQYQKAQWRLDNPTEVAKQEAKATIAAIGKLMLLPADEEPTVVQVTDISKLKDQPFFANAQNGDKVLIYTKAKKAILYRPGTNKIIDVGPVNIGNSATPSAQTNPTPPAALQPATPPAAPNIIIQ